MTLKCFGMSGEHIEQFREGWAILPFVGHATPHYWRRQDLTHRFRALCGIECDQTNHHPGARRQFAPGDFMPCRCKRCRRVRERR